MERFGRRILLAVQPTVLEGALARMLTTGRPDEVVQLGRTGANVADGGYDAAVVCDELPDGIQAAVVITLPDTRGSGGTGTITRGGVVYEVSIGGAERVVELLDEYVDHR